MMEVDRAAHLANQDRLRALRRQHGHAERIFCARDPVELTSAVHGV